MSDYCPECGSDDFREPYNNGHRQCNDKTCLQEFFVDVKYCAKDTLKSKHSEISKLKTDKEVLEKRIKRAEKLLLDRHEMYSMLGKVDEYFKDEYGEEEHDNN